MARTIQILRGTQSQNDSFTGRIGELTYDKTNNSLRVHDGSTSGGNTVGGAGVWGSVPGTLSSQTDLNTALNSKSDYTEMVGFDCGSISDSLDGDLIDSTPLVKDSTTGAYTEVMETVNASVDVSGFLLRTTYNQQIADAEDYIGSLA